MSSDRPLVLYRWAEQPDLETKGIAGAWAWRKPGSDAVMMLSNPTHGINTVYTAGSIEGARGFLVSEKYRSFLRSPTKPREKKTTHLYRITLPNGGKDYDPIRLLDMVDTGEEKYPKPTDAAFAKEYDRYRMEIRKDHPNYDRYVTQRPEATGNEMLQRFPGDKLWRNVNYQGPDFPDYEKERAARAHKIAVDGTLLNTVPINDEIQVKGPLPPSTIEHVGSVDFLPSEWKGGNIDKILGAGQVTRLRPARRAVIPDGLRGITHKPTEKLLKKAAKQEAKTAKKEAKAATKEAKAAKKAAVEPGQAAPAQGPSTAELRKLRESDA